MPEQSLYPTFMMLGVMLQFLTTTVETAQLQHLTRSDTEVIITIPTLDFTISIRDITTPTQVDL